MGLKSTLVYCDETSLNHTVDKILLGHRISLSLTHTHTLAHTYTRTNILCNTTSRLAKLWNGWKKAENGVEDYPPRHHQTITLTIYFSLWIMSCKVFHSNFLNFWFEVFISWFELLQFLIWISQILDFSYFSSWF